MLSHDDFLEATRRFKDKRTKLHARTRYHALLLVSKGFSYRQTADILFVDPGVGLALGRALRGGRARRLAATTHAGAGSTGNAGSVRSS